MEANVNVEDDVFDEDDGLWWIFRLVSLSVANNLYSVFVVVKFEIVVDFKFNEDGDGDNNWTDDDEVLFTLIPLNIFDDSRNVKYFDVEECGCK